MVLGKVSHPSLQGPRQGLIPEPVGPRQGHALELEGPRQALTPRPAGS